MMTPPCLNLDNHEAGCHIYLQLTTAGGNSSKKVFEKYFGQAFLTGLTGLT